MRVKKIARARQTSSCLDVAGNSDTLYSSMLARPGDIVGGSVPWVVGETYFFEVQHRGTISKIEILGSSNWSMASVEITDDLYINGGFGGFIFSKDQAFFSDFSTTTLDEIWDSKSQGR